MTAASGTAITRANPNLGQTETQQPFPRPRQRLSPPAPDYRLAAARVKDALRAPATPAKVLDPAARSHEPAAITGKHNR